MKAEPKPDPKFMPGRGAGTPFRSKWSGKTGTAYLSDPHVWVEGPYVAGWYRLAEVERDFLIVEEEQKSC